jgi:hypothetical protein
MFDLGVHYDFLYFIIELFWLGKNAFVTLSSLVMALGSLFLLEDRDVCRDVLAEE